MVTFTECSELTQILRAPWSDRKGLVNSNKISKNKINKVFNPNNEGKGEINYHPPKYLPG
jgi:hypothetical protein